MRSALLVTVLGLGSVLLGGCGGDGIPRVAVEGQVTLDGAPLHAGSVTFIPVGPGPAAGATIENGRYAIPVDGGPSPGEYRVEIRSPKATGKQVVGTDGTTMEAEFEEAVPDKYNNKTELKVTLNAGEKNQSDFVLTQ